MGTLGFSNVYKTRVKRLKKKNKKLAMIKTVNPLLESSAYFMFPVATDFECNI